MSSDKDEDDKPTVMLNLDELKKQNIMDVTGVSQLLEFSATKELLDTASDREKIKACAFDFNSHFFSDNIQTFGECLETNIVKDVKELNKLITANKEGVFLFYFNDAGKQINALLAQINQKFPNLKTVLIAKNLSENKAATHQKSPSGAKAYLSWPCDSKKIHQALSKIK